MSRWLWFGQQRPLDLFASRLKGNNGEGFFASRPEGNDGEGLIESAKIMYQWPLKRREKKNAIFERRRIFLLKSERMVSLA